MRRRLLVTGSVLLAVAAIVLLAYGWFDSRAELDALADAVAVLEAEPEPEPEPDADDLIVVKKEEIRVGGDGDLLGWRLWYRTAEDEIRIWVRYTAVDEEEDVRIEVWQCYELVVVDYRLPDCVHEYPSDWDE